MYPAVILLVMPAVNASLSICNWLKVLLCPARFRTRWLLPRFLVLGLFMMIWQTVLFYPASHSSLNEDKIEAYLTPSNSSRIDAYVIVFVLSAPKNTFARNTVRKTWASEMSGANSECRVVFLLGKSEDVELQRHIEHEAVLYGDILQGDLPDTYHFLLLKVMMALRWSNTMNFRYIVKTDDDLYVNIPLLLNWLHNNKHPKMLYAGKVTVRQPIARYRFLSSYPVAYEDYGGKYYPPYCIGALYVISGDLVRVLLDKALEQELFPVEDAYIGVLAKAVGLTPLNLYPHLLRVEKANRWKRRSTDECDLNRYIAIGDGLEPSDLVYVHDIVWQRSGVTASRQQRCSSDGSVLTLSSRRTILFGVILLRVFLSENSLSFY